MHRGAQGLLLPGSWPGMHLVQTSSELSLPWLLPLAGPDTQPMRHEGALEEAGLDPPLSLLIGPEAALAVD